MILDQVGQILLSAITSEFYHSRLTAAMGRMYFST